MVKNGRYGPYVSHDGVNATLPSDMTPETVTLEQAVGLLDARAARGGGKKPPAKRAQHRAQGTGTKTAAKPPPRRSRRASDAAKPSRRARSQVGQLIRGRPSAAGMPRNGRAGRDLI